MRPLLLDIIINVKHLKKKHEKKATTEQICCKFWFYGRILLEFYYNSIW